MNEVDILRQYLKKQKTTIVNPDVDILKKAIKQKQTKERLSKMIEGAKEFSGIASVERLWNDITNIPEFKKKLQENPSAKIAEIAGDIGSTAMIPIAGVSGAVIGAGAGAAAGTVDFAEKYKQFTDKLYDILNMQEFLGKNLQKSELANILAQTPAFAITTLIDVLPVLLLKTKKGIKIKEGIEKSPLAKKAEALKIPVTESAEIIEKAKEGKKLSPAEEKLATKEIEIQQKYPELYEKFRQKQQEAIKEKLPQFEKTSYEIGSEVVGGLEKKIEKTKEIYKENLETIKSVNKNLSTGKTASDKIKKYLLNQGVEDIKKMTGNEDIAKAEAELLFKASQQIKNAKSIKDLINQKINLNNVFEKTFSENIVDRKSYHIKNLYKIIDETIYEKLNEVNPKIATEWKKTNEKYAVMKDFLNNNTKLLDKSPELLFKNVIKSTDDLKTIKEFLKNDKLIKEAGWDYLIQKSMKNNYFDIDAFEKNFNALGKEKQNLLFGKEVDNIKDFIDVVKFAEAPQKVMGINKIGGSQTAFRWIIDRAAGGFSATKNLVSGLLRSITDKFSGAVENVFVKPKAEKFLFSGIKEKPAQYIPFKIAGLVSRLQLAKNQLEQEGENK